MNIDNEISKDDLFRKIDDLKIKLYDTNDALKSAENRIKELNKCNDYANEELDQYKNNWEEIKRLIKEKEQHYLNDDCPKEIKHEFLRISNEYTKILNKMKELEEGK